MDPHATLEKEVYKKACDELQYWIEINEKHQETMYAQIEENLDYLLLGFGHEDALKNIEDFNVTAIFIIY